jgi:N utilization substance protein B
VTSTGSAYTGGLGSRREARERALTLLYEAEAKSIDPAAVLATLPLEPERFTADLVEGVSEHLVEIDEVISARSVGWPLERMPSLDRAVLRIATFELLHRPDIPAAATINEAVELAKTFSTDDSGKFVNGVLSAVARDHAID